jgi:hypothetical protein
MERERKKRRRGEAGSGLQSGKPRWEHLERQPQVPKVVD